MLSFIETVSCFTFRIAKFCQQMHWLMLTVSIVCLLDSLAQRCNPNSNYPVKAPFNFNKRGDYKFVAGYSMNIDDMLKGSGVTFVEPKFRITEVVLSGKMSESKLLTFS